MDSTDSTVTFIHFFSTKNIDVYCMYVKLYGIFIIEKFIGVIVLLVCT